MSLLIASCVLAFKTRNMKLLKYRRFHFIHSEYFHFIHSESVDEYLQEFSSVNWTTCIQSAKQWNSVERTRFVNGFDTVFFCCSSLVVLQFHSYRYRSNRFWNYYFVFFFILNGFSDLNSFELQIWVIIDKWIAIRLRDIEDVEKWNWTRRNFLESK